MNTLLLMEGQTITIGDNTGISNSALVAVDSIAIGNNVLIGGNCKIYDNDFHSLDFNERMGTVDLGVKHAPVVIKDGAFICNNRDDNCFLCINHVPSSSLSSCIIAIQHSGSYLYNLFGVGNKK